MRATSSSASDEHGQLDARRVLDAFSDAVIAADRRQRIVYANAAAERLLQWPVDELVGQPVSVIVPERLRAAHLDAFRAFAESGRGTILGRAVELPALRRDGTEGMVDLLLTPLDDPSGGGVVVVGSLRDAGPRVLVERQSVVAEQLLAVLGANASLAEAAPRLLEVLATHLRWDVAQLWVLDQTGRRLRLAGLWHLPDIHLPAFTAASRAMRFGFGRGLPGRVGEARKPAWVADVTRDDNFSRAAAAAQDGLRSAFAFPILSGERLLGVIELFSLEPRGPDPGLEEALSTIGGRLGEYLEGRLEAEADAAQRQRLALALEAGRLGVWEWDLGTGSMTLSDGLTGYLFQEPRDDVTLDDYVAAVHPDDREAVVRAIRRVEHSPAEARYHVEHRIVRRGGDVGWISATGTVLRDEAGRNVVTGVASDISARKEAEAQQQRLQRSERAAQWRLEMLADASATLASSLDYATTLARVAELAVPDLADICLVHGRRDDDAITLLKYACADPGLATALAGLQPVFTPHHPPEAAVAQALLGGELIHVTDPAIPVLLGSDADVLAACGVTSAVVAPLIARERILGALTFACTTGHRTYSEEDVALAEELARRAAMAMDNARLYRERTQVATALQNSLLPPRLPRIPGLDAAARYRAAGEGVVGGDFYDVFPVRGDAWGVVIGDVRGKGADAAAVTGLARWTVRGAAMQTQRADRVLFILNQALLQEGDGLEPRFCTVSFVRLEPQADGAFKIGVAGGGHPLPLVVDPLGRVRTLGEDSGVVLGLFPDIDVPCHESRLEPGETLLLYTDGVTEARDGKRLFGEHGLHRALGGSTGRPAHQVLEEIEAAIADLEPGARDDIAMVAIRVDDRGTDGV